MTDKKSTGGYKLIKNTFGKCKSKILHLSRDGPINSIREFEITHQVTLAKNKEFNESYNSVIAESDSHAKLLYILAKNEGINSPEEFGIAFCKELLSRYKQILKVFTQIEETTWNRIKYEEGGEGYDHGFVNDPTCNRFSKIELSSEDEFPSITSGFKNFRVLKTNKRTFHGFNRDEICMVPNFYDQILSTSMNCSWIYAKNPKINFDETFKKIQEQILFNFAGNYDDGLVSTSTQSTTYNMEKSVLDEVKEVESIRMKVPNLYYNAFDFKKFEKFDSDNDETVFIPLEQPHGIVHADLRRE